MPDVDLWPPHEHINMHILYTKYFVFPPFHRYFICNRHIAAEHIYRYSDVTSVSGGDNGHVLRLRHSSHLSFPCVENLQNPL